MTQTVKLKRSATPGKIPVPADLELGELAINTFDGKIYFEKDDGTASIVRVANASEVSAKQDTLVSGTSIKTVNSSSLLGSGNLVVGDVTLTGTETLTNKTLTAPTLNAGYTEQVYAISGTTPALSPANGSIQTWTLTANSTPTAGTWAAGQSITLMVNDSASSFTVTWTSLPITWVGGSAPTLAPASGYTVIQLWKVGTTIYGCLTGQVA